MKNKNIIISTLLLIITVVYTLVVKMVDVSSIGPNGSSVGLSTINKWFNDLFKYNSSIYKITEYLGYIALLVCGIYAVIGVSQLIKRKSLKKVDTEIYLLAGFYVIVLGLYVVFEKVIINYRPVILEGVLEASYPSSHTMLALCVCGSAIIINNKLFKNVKNIKIVNILLIVLMVSILVGRTICGVHWLSDIIGGVLISTTLLKSFETIIEPIKNKTIK